MGSIVTARKRSLGQGNIFTPVCHSVHRGVPGQVPPWDQVHPPGPGTSPTPWDQVHLPDQVHSPWDQVHPQTRYIPWDHVPPQDQVPPEQCMLGDTGNKRVVRILLECILVIFSI